MWQFYKPLHAAPTPHGHLVRIHRAVQTWLQRWRLLWSVCYFCVFLGQDQVLGFIEFCLLSVSSAQFHSSVFLFIPLFLEHLGRLALLWVLEVPWVVLA